VIAITGVGAWSCFGRGTEPILRALAHGRRGLGPLTRFDTDDPWLRTTVGMCAPGWRPGTGRAANAWSHALAEAEAAAATAATQAGLDSAPYSASRVAVLGGTTHGSGGPLDYLRAARTGAPDPELLAWTAAELTRRVARVVGARGPSLALNTACSSGANAIGQAARLLSSGAIDCAVAGGADLVSLVTYLGFNSLAALSRTGCRPLDIDRDGLSLGDGAAFLVLEREADADRRGTRSLGYLTGYACAGEGFHPTAPDPEGRGARHVMRAALAGDGRPSELALVCAHGTGTPANDAAEVAAIGAVATEVDAPGPVRVFSLKATLGHTLGAAGALEAAVTLTAMRRGLVPGTPGLERPVEHEDRLRLDATPTRGETPRLALCNSFGFGGSVAALCLRAARPLQED